MAPYRNESHDVELRCPRCRKLLPLVDVAACTCGTWLSAFAATEVLAADERRADLVTRWWRVREPCPMCGEQMTLRGIEPGLFQGCDGHGFWIDADAIALTGLARGVDHDALDRKRNRPDVIEAEREARGRAELERATRRADKERAEAMLRKEIARREEEAAARLVQGTAPYSPLHAELGREVDAIARLEHELSELDDGPRHRDLTARIEALERRIAAIEALLQRR